MMCSGSTIVLGIAIVLVLIAVITVVIRRHHQGKQAVHNSRCGACADRRQPSQASQKPEKQGFGLPLNNLDPNASTETPVINTAEYMPMYSAYTKAFAAGPPYDAYVSRPPR